MIRPKKDRQERTTHLIPTNAIVLDTDQEALPFDQPVHHYEIGIQKGAPIFAILHPLYKETMRL